MSSNKILLLTAWAVLAVSAPAAAEGSGPAVADTPIAETGAPVSATVDISAGSIEPVVADDGLAALDDGELSSLRGGEALVVSNQTLTAITSGNVINGNYVAGNVSLSDHALSSFNGVGNLLINTGGQVSLQTGMNLTINVGD
jgi:hypothetical protein